LRLRFLLPQILARDLLQLRRSKRGFDLSRSIDRVAAEIRRYCAAHPDARDTIEGITWWVSLQRQHDLKSAVSAAVQLLVQQGALARHRLQDGSEVFSCNKSMAAAEIFLDQDRQ
jgi:hypothetical protein